MSERPETAPMKFGDDWTGVFIRGDNACWYAKNIEAILELPQIAPQIAITLSGLKDILSSCNERSMPEGMEVQCLKPYIDCKITPSIPAQINGEKGAKK